MNRIEIGDNREILPRWINEGVRVHQVVTSPPYDRLRVYGRDRGWHFETTAHHLYQILAPGGVVCWNVNDSVVDGAETLTSARQKLYFADVVGFRVHDTMIYEKRNFSHPERDRYHQLFEYVFVLSKGRPRCFHPIKDKPNTAAGLPGSVGINTVTQRDGSKALRRRRVNVPFGMRGNVWRGKTRGQEEMCRRLPHPAMMPRWLAADLIRSWSNPGDLILDPFAGAGTTAGQADRLGRRWLACDSDPRCRRLHRDEIRRANA